jgi:ABC-type amino acid transport substrate-binding protein
MKLQHILLVIILALGAGYLGARYAPSAQSTTVKETSFERVMRTSVLRCGYGEWDGAVEKNPNTGEFSGAVVEIVNEMAKAMNLKIEWVSQINWGDVTAAIKSNKIDAMCAGMWTSATKAKDIAFTRPFAYQGVEAFVRTGDTRFDGDMSKINDPAVKVAIIDGDNSQFIAENDFPKAERLALGHLTSTDKDLMMHVITNKADVTFSVTGLYHIFNKSEPGKLRRLAPGHYLRVFGLSPVVVDNEDPRFLQLLNDALQEVANSGFVSKTLDKYDPRYPDLFVRATKDYQ